MPGVGHIKVVKDYVAVCDAFPCCIHFPEYTIIAEAMLDMASWNRVLTEIPRIYGINTLMLLRLQGLAPVIIPSDLKLFATEIIAIEHPNALGFRKASAGSFSLVSC